MQYKIEGTPLPVVICQLDRGECMMTEKGSMSWMTPNMKMETTSNGGIGKALGRMLAGESIFQNRYTAEGGEGMIAFASSFPGTILPVEITPDRPVIVQKSAFLAGVESVDISLFLQKKLGAGFFGGEGFIMQKLSGEGIVFVEIDGSTVEYGSGAGTADDSRYRLSCHDGRHLLHGHNSRKRSEKYVLRRRRSVQYCHNRSRQNSASDYACEQRSRGADTVHAFRQLT